MLNEKKFRAIYDEFLASGLTIRDFCANHQMNEAKFYYWQNKLKGQLPPRKGFVPLVFENGQQTWPAPAPTQNRSHIFSNQVTAGNPVYCEVTYPNGVCIKLNGLSDPEMLRSLLVLTRQ
jgi:hypothetical protein